MVQETFVFQTGAEGLVKHGTAQEMNATNKRKLPEDAPTEFVSKTIRPLVVSDGVIDKHAWECALIRKIRDEIKSGNI